MPAIHKIRSVQAAFAMREIRPEGRVLLPLEEDGLWGGIAEDEEYAEEEIRRLEPLTEVDRL